MSFGGGVNTAEKYAKFGAGKYSSSDFERYVDSRPDLAAAWRKIESDPSAPDSRYWIDKGASNKSAFGRAHAAEDAELYAGTYGDSGDTKVLPGTPEYKAYFGDSGGTSFDSFISSPSSSGGESLSSGAGSFGTQPNLGPYPNENIYFPVLETEYTAPNAQDFSAYMPVDGLLTGGAQARYPQAIFPPLDNAGNVLPQTPSAPITDGQQFDIGGLLYQPWSTEYQQAFVPGNIWQYDPNQFGVGEVSYRSNPFGSIKFCL